MKNIIALSTVLFALVAGTMSAQANPAAFGIENPETVEKTFGIQYPETFDNAHGIDYPELP